MTYEDDLNTRASQLVDRVAKGLDVETADAFAPPLDWAKADQNDGYFAKLLHGKVITTKELKAARAKARRAGEIIAELGSFPSDPDEFVTLHAEQLNVRIDRKGTIMVGEDFDTLPELKNRMRRANTNLRLGFTSTGVDDATDHYFRSAKIARTAEIVSMLSTRREFPWDDFVETFFTATDETSLPLTQAILRKFVHSVRRKMVGLDVANHLMPVVYGVQGCGKTYLLERMFAPIGEAVANSDFEQVVDGRNLKLWDNFVIFLDEMAKAGRADIESVKHGITAKTLDRRPLYSNETATIVNKATFAGASNHRIDEVIKDETGNRRFAQIAYRVGCDRDAIKRFDFHAMWCSIQPDDADPMAEFADELRAAQAEFRTLGPVEDWLESFADDGAERRVAPVWIKETSQNLYEQFCAHRRKVTAGASVDYQGRTLTAFSTELRRIAEARPELEIRKTREPEGMRWYRGEPTPAQIRAAEITGSKVTRHPSSRGDA